MSRKYALFFLLLLLSSCEKNQDDHSQILKFYGDALEDIGYSVARLETGYAIAGQFTEVNRNGGNFIDFNKSVKKMGVIKTDINGNVIWEKIFGDSMQAVGSKVISLGDGSVVCTGYVTDPNTLQKDIFVVKVNAEGTESIQRTYNSKGDQIMGNYNDGNQAGIDIVETAEGFLILGSTDNERQAGSGAGTGNTSGMTDILLLRIKNNLEKINDPVAWGYPKNDSGVAIKTDRDGGYIIVGTTDKPEEGKGVYNIFLLWTNADASSTKIKILGGKDDEYAADIEVLDDGYFIAGTVGAEGADQSVYLAKVPPDYADNNKEPLFEYKMKFANSSSSATSFSAKAIGRYKTNSFVIAGQAGVGSSADMLIFAVDAGGLLIEGKEIITGASGAQVAYDAISDENDNIIAVGKNSFENNSLICLFKFRF